MVSVGTGSGIVIHGIRAEMFGIEIPVTSVGHLFSVVLVLSIFTLVIINNDFVLGLETSTSILL